MNLQVGRWGNNLTLRLPASVVCQLGLCELLPVHAQVAPDGALAIRTAEWRRLAFVAELSAAIAALPMGQSVVDEPRRA